jgi:hypothetical protein
MVKLDAECAQLVFAMNAHQRGGLFLAVGGIYITLWAYGFVKPRQVEAIDPSRLKRLKWLGPLTFAIGLGNILLKGSS